MTYHIDIQHACQHPSPFDDAMITLWAEATLKSVQESGEITIRLVDAEEMTYLNLNYRQQNKPTNVLAFPSNLPPEVAFDCPLLGDVIICPEVLEQESLALHTSLQAHWAHIVIHGILHLLGYDHIQAEDAKIMEQREIRLLANFGFDNPYHEEPHFD